MRTSIILAFVLLLAGCAGTPTGPTGLTGPTGPTRPTPPADPLQTACAAVDVGDSLAAAQQRLGRSPSPADAGADAHYTFSQVAPGCFCAVYVRADRVTSRRYGCAEPTSPR